MKESELQDLIRMALNHPDACFWRNNIGVAERNGHMIRFGVGGPGGADLIGIFRGRFVAIEIKTPTGRQSGEQKTFETLVTSKQGLYVILRSVDEARALIQQLEATW